ncbi:MAG: GNAT family N-acetyltransferase [Bacteroidota bacterium]|nr:GNAT family N-acetyltransferase [Bacteroidota bacterium]
MEIVRVSPADINHLLHLSRKTFYDSFHQLNKPENMEAYMDFAFTHDRLLAEIENPDTEFYFVKVDDLVLGYLKINRNGAQSEFKDPKSLEIERIYVDQAYQGLGIGTMLIERAKDIALDEGKDYVWLGVWEKNPGAIRLYERNGFQSFSEHEFIMGDEVQMDKLMMCRV